MSADSTTDLPEDRRRLVFEALVATQDGGETVTSSRETVATRYGLCVDAVKAIEREGLDQDWLS